MINLKAVIEKDSEFETNIIKAIAQANKANHKITFFMNDNHLATTFTDNEGKAEAGTSYDENKDYFFSAIIDDEESETVKILKEGE